MFGRYVQALQAGMLAHWAQHAAAEAVCPVQKCPACVMPASGTTVNPGPARHSSRQQHSQLLLLLPLLLLCVCVCVCSE